MTRTWCNDSGDRITARYQRADVFDTFYKSRHAVDDNNIARQGSRCIEDTRQTKTWWHRSFSFFISLAEANDYRVCVHFVASMADETLSRIDRALENGAITATPPGRFCYVVARSVLLEDFRREDYAVECVEDRLQKLKQQERELIVEYYRGAGQQMIERRRDLAERLGISLNALGIRATRLRDALEASCVGAQLSDDGSGPPELRQPQPPRMS